MNERDQDGMAAAPVQSRDRVLGVFSRYPSALLLLLVFAVEVGVGLFVIRDVKMASAEAQQMYARSVLRSRRVDHDLHLSKEGSPYLG